VNNDVQANALQRTSTERYKTTEKEDILNVKRIFDTMERPRNFIMGRKREKRIIRKEDK
jgi:hypothetical protein